MADNYAEPLDREVYDCDEFTSRFLPRIHRHTTIADHASVQCHLDLYGDDGVGSKFGNLNAHAGNFVSLCAPNCLPERLALVAYTIEYAFLHDDDLDNGTDEQVLHENEMLHQALTQSGTTSITSRLTEATRRKSEAQAKIAAEYLRLDPVFGNWLVSCWEAFTKSTEDGRNLEFASLDDYLAFRLDDVAAVWTLSMLRWGTGIYLTPAEERIADPLSYVAYAALTLTNDLFSWEKEYKAYNESKGSVPLMNAVHTVMVSHGLQQDAAKSMIRDELRAHEERFCQMREDYLSGPSPSPSIIQWLRLLEDTMAGNFIWSIRVPRYCQTDRDPYRDHLDAFSRDEITVLAAPVETPRGAPDISRGCPTHCDQTPKNRATKGSLQDSNVDLLKAETVLNPYAYIASLPSKNVRQTMILALNTWYKVPEKSLLIIEGVVNFLHNSSLLLDDIQDGSALRRGKPAAHRIFGVGQTINTATYLMNEALCLIQMLSRSALTAYSEEMRNLHIGQGHDLHWSYHTHVPSQEEYIGMVDGKTGGLFRLICRLMRCEASVNRNLDLTNFATLLGRYFQIRDDYQNLVSADYKQSKGFCEDLDEGKLSFPIILAMNSPGFPNAVILSIFQSCHEQRSQSPELKQYLLDQITSRKVFPRTQDVLKELHTELLRSLSDLEKASGGIENWTLRLLVAKLNVKNDAKTEIRSQDSVWRVNQRRVWDGHQGQRPTENSSLSRKRKRV